MIRRAVVRAPAAVPRCVASYLRQPLPQRLPLRRRPHDRQNNAFVRSVRNIPLFFTSPATFSSLPSNQSYRPLVTTTLAVDYWLGGGLNPFAFHVTSFGLFLVQCALLLVLYRRVMDRARPDDAATAGSRCWRRRGTRCTRPTPRR